MTIPVGTICLIVGDVSCVWHGTEELCALPSRICTIVGHGDARCGGGPSCRHVCEIEYSNGLRGCAFSWRPLRPITPPASDVTETEREAIEA